MSQKMKWKVGKGMRANAAAFNAGTLLIAGVVVFGSAFYVFQPLTTGFDSLLGAASASDMPTTMGSPWELYDYDSDAKVGLKDVLVLLKLSMASTSCPARKVCDIDASGKIDNADVKTLLEGLISGVPPAAPKVPPVPVSIATTFLSAYTNVTAGQSSSDDLGTFTIKFSVTAIGGDVYLPSIAKVGVAGSVPTTTVVYVDRAGVPVTKGASVVLINSSAQTITSMGAAPVYLVKDGQTARFEVTTTVQLPAAGVAGLYRTRLGALRYGYQATKMNQTYVFKEALATPYVGLN